jgi:hypothetical protein
MANMYAIRLSWRHEGKRVEACALIQAASASSAMERAQQLLPNRIPGGGIEILSAASKVQDNCFIVSGKEPAFPKQITPLGASF